MMVMVMVLVILIAAAMVIRSFEFIVMDEYFKFRPLSYLFNFLLHVDSNDWQLLGHILLREVASIAMLVPIPTSVCVRTSGW
jgi:hypothetical protein